MLLRAQESARQHPQPGAQVTISNKTSPYRLSPRNIFAPNFIGRVPVALGSIRDILRPKRFGPAGNSSQTATSSKTTVSGEIRCLCGAAGIIPVSRQASTYLLPRICRPSCCAALGRRLRTVYYKCGGLAPTCPRIRTRPDFLLQIIPVKRTFIGLLPIRWKHELEPTTRRQLVRTPWLSASRSDDRGGSD